MANFADSAPRVAADILIAAMEHNRFNPATGTETPHQVIENLVKAYTTLYWAIKKPAE